MSLKTQKHELKMIAISKKNYLLLKKLGGAGDSYNDVITQILSNVLTTDEKLVSQKSSKMLLVRGVEGLERPITDRGNTQESGSQ